MAVDLRKFEKVVSLALNGATDRIDGGLDELVDIVVDWREPLRGHVVIAKPAGWFDNHPMGEGNPEIFRIFRVPLRVLADLAPREKQPTDDGFTFVYRKRIAEKVLERATPNKERLPNLYIATTLPAVDTTEAELKYGLKILDTLQNATLTVGTGKTYATISAAVAAASSGDTIQVYSTTNDTYTENVTLNKTLNVVGMVGNRGVTISTSDGHAIVFDGVKYIVLDNFHLEPTNGYGVYNNSSACSTIKNCSVKGATTGFNAGVACRAINCLAYDCSGSGFAQSRYYYLHCIHCTSVDNGQYGFAGLPGDAGTCICCLAAGNSSGDFSADTNGVWNTSADASAPGSGSQTGFQTSDFVDYANDDFRLKSSVISTTKARFQGYSFIDKDGFGNTRKHLTDGSINYVYAGWHDPDPAGTAPTFTGTITASRTPGENAITLDLSGCTISNADHLRVYVRAGAQPTTADETYLAQIARPTDTTIKVRMDKDFNRLKGTETYYIKVVAVSSDGTKTENPSVISLKPAGYLELAD